jgi:hypothetical protein
MIYKKINNVSIFLTALVSYGIWYLFNPVTILNNDILQKAIKIIISSVFSFGFFSIIVPALSWIINKCKFIKKIVFSANYIEGVWIGFFINRKGVALTIQRIEQTSDEVSIFGETFKYNKGNPIFRSFFNSTGASFDYNKHILYCTYLSDKLDGVNAGFLTYYFSNQEKKVPDTFWGYLSNYIYDGKMFFLCKKYCDTEKIPDLQSWINTAKEFYENNKDYFKHIIDENMKKNEEIKNTVTNQNSASGVPSVRKH